jgi:hypothetical protein
MVSISTGLLQYTGWQASPGASSETLHRMAAWGFWIYLLGESPSNNIPKNQIGI